LHELGFINQVTSRKDSAELLDGETSIRQQRLNSIQEGHGLSIRRGQIDPCPSPTTETGSHEVDSKIKNKRVVGSCGIALNQYVIECCGSGQSLAPLTPTPLK
jgi:hypothetical protein